MLLVLLRLGPGLVELRAQRVGLAAGHGRAGDRFVLTRSSCGAFALHFALALRTIYQRRHWQLPATEWLRLWSGFSLPLLLIEFIMEGFAALAGVGALMDHLAPPLAEGTKSVSFRLTVGSAERTLSSEEIAVVRAAIIAGMQDAGYELRV